MKTKETRTTLTPTTNEHYKSPVVQHMKMYIKKKKRNINIQVFAAHITMSLKNNKAVLFL